MIMVPRESSFSRKIPSRSAPSLELERVYELERSRDRKEAAVIAALIIVALFPVLIGGVLITFISR